MCVEGPCGAEQVDGSLRLTWTVASLEELVLEQLTRRRAVLPINSSEAAKTRLRMRGSGKQGLNIGKGGTNRRPNDNDQTNCPQSRAFHLPFRQGAIACIHNAL